MLTAVLAVAVLAGSFFGWALARAAGRPDPVDAAYDTLPAGRPLRIDTITGPAAYAALTPDAEPPIPAGWLTDLHTLPTTYDREYPR